MDTVEWSFVSDRPVWTQITEQMRQRIVAGVYPSGEKLPSVRDLAMDAGVNPNTMQRALAQLEADGLAVSNRTSGRAVTDDEEAIFAARVKMADEKIDEYLAGMTDLGFTAVEARDLLMKREEK